MLFIVNWEIPQVGRRAAIERFLETGGSPPQGVTMLHRWHSADGAFGFAIAESNDASGLAKWATQWNDLLAMDVRPALDDEAMAAVLAAS